MLRMLLLATVFGGILHASLSLPARAAFLTVTSTADSGPGTLRNAILTAGSGDAINITATGTITPLTELPAVDKNLSIFGPGANALTISGSSCSSCSGLTVIAGGSLSVFGVTVRDFTVSGVHSSGNHVGVVTSVITQNTAGMKLIAGTQNAGGGIYATTGSISVLNSTISGNTASRWGGGISAETGTSSVGISGSTIDGNTTPGQGGGIYTRSLTQITNSTISGNTSGSSQGGGIYNSNALSLFNVTVGDNINGQLASGAIVPGQTITAGNTIIARGGGGSGANCTATTFGSLGNNISTDGTCALGGTGDLINTNPLLLPLANNGGSTRTHLIATGSPAIDGGSNTGCPGVDQRGLPRPADGDGNGSSVCDIGAVEVQAALAPPAVSKSFSPAAIMSGGTSRLTLQFNNNNAGLGQTLTNVSITDNLPIGMTVAPTPNVTTTCTGATVTAAPGSGTVSMSGASIGPVGSCILSVTVSAAGSGVLTNTAGPVSAQESGPGGTATAQLTVQGGVVSPGASTPTPTTVVPTPTPAPFVPLIIPQQVQNPGAVAIVQGGIGNGTRNNTPVPLRPASSAPVTGGTMPVITPPSTGDAGLWPRPVAHELAQAGDWHR